MSGLNFVHTGPGSRRAHAAVELRMCKRAQGRTPQSKLIVCTRWRGSRGHDELPRDGRRYGIGGTRREGEVVRADATLVGRDVQRLDGGAAGMGRSR